MAKQGINPLEQHVEKIVAGIAALLFVFVVFNYVISTPVMVRVANQTIPPGDLDRKLGEIADDVAGVYRRATWTPPTTRGTNVEPIIAEIRKVQDSLAQTPPSMVSPVRWGPELPPPPKEGPGLEGRHDLAAVGAPVIAAVYTGVTTAGLAAQPAPASEIAAAMVPAALNNQDVVWAFLRLTFDVQAQYDAFRAKGYSPEQANLILFLDVQVQRQRVWPDGTTGPWEDVKTYKTVQAAWPQAVEIGPDGRLSYADEQTMTTLFKAVAAAQQNILYPLPTIVGGDPFPPYFKDGVPPLLAESAPTPPPGLIRPPTPVNRPMPNLGRGPARSGGREGGGGRDPERRSAPDEGRDRRGGPSMGPGMGQSPTVDKTAQIAGNQAIQEAKKAFSEKRYQEARNLLERARGLPTLQRQVLELEAQINAAVTKMQEDEKRLADRKAASEARNAEIWVYDMDAPAGKTYRYRARVLLLNVYAHPVSDRIGELKDPKLGGQVALAGEWSDPSGPIRLADSRYFFLTNASAEKEVASVDIFRYQQGRWFKDIQRNSLAIGDPIGEVKPVPTTAGKIDVDYRTGQVVVDITTDAMATIGSDNKGTKVGIQKRPSALLVSMDADGAMSQHWAAIDKGCQMYKELDARVKATADLPVAATGLPR